MINITLWPITGAANMTAPTPVQYTNPFAIFTMWLHQYYWCNWHCFTNILVLYPLQHEYWIYWWNLPVTPIGVITNNQFSQNFCRFAAPIYWCEMVSSTNVLVRVMLAALCLIVRTLPMNLVEWAETEILLFSRWRQHKRLSSTADRELCLTSANFPTSLSSRWSLPLRLFCIDSFLFLTTFCEILFRLFSSFWKFHASFSPDQFILPLH